MQTWRKAKPPDRHSPVYCFEVILVGARRGFGVPQPRPPLSRAFSFSYSWHTLKASMRKAVGRFPTPMPFPCFHSIGPHEACARHAVHAKRKHVTERSQG